MRVDELISLLRNYPGDMEVVIYDDEYASYIQARPPEHKRVVIENENRREISPNKVDAVVL